MSRLFSKPWLGVTVILVITLLVVIGLASARAVTASPGKLKGMRLLSHPLPNMLRSRLL